MPADIVNCPIGNRLAPVRFGDSSSRAFFAREKPETAVSLRRREDQFALLNAWQRVKDRAVACGDSGTPCARLFFTRDAGSSKPGVEVDLLAPIAPRRFRSCAGL